MTKYMMTGLIFSILTCSVIVPVCAVEPKGTGQTVTTHKFSQKEEAVWHVKEGERLSQQGKSADAAVHWREALRLDPDNQDASNDLQKALAESVIPGVKAALTKYANASDMTDFASILTDRSADPVSARLLVEYRSSIQEVAGGLRSADGSLFDDFEDFMLRNGLYGMIAKYGAWGGAASGYSTNDVRLKGRPLLLELARWNKRMLRSGINIKLEPTRHILTLVNGLDRYQYRVHSSTWVEIDGTDTDDNIPLEARFEDGAWRIGAAGGSAFHFNTNVRLRYFGK